MEASVKQIDYLESLANLLYNGSWGLGSQEKKEFANFVKALIRQHKSGEKQMTSQQASRLIRIVKQKINE